MPLADSLSFVAVDDEGERMSKKSNPLSSRQEVVASLHDLLGALDKSFPQDCSRFSLGETCAHYP
ncbi:hypothetical protein ABZE59_008910, partial [Enterobacter cloacae subsp. cloacae]